MKEVYLTRQRDILPPSKLGSSITVIGAGAIGSFVVLALAKMGYSNITVYDDDTVDSENMNCQFYPEHTIGQYKTTALKTMIKAFTGVTINVFTERVTSDTIIDTDYTICAVDDMAVRKMVFDEACASRWLIDPRMSAEFATMYTVDMTNLSDRASYAKSLYTNEDAVQERCTAKSTMYTVMLISGQVAKAVKDITMENPYIDNFDWNIAKNSLMAFDNSGARL